MNTLPLVAKNRAVRLHQELVETLRATGSLAGADQFWRHVNFKKGLGRKLACYGFAKRERQIQINKVAFPDANFSEVDAALRAGNNLYQLYQLASGGASLARDETNRYKRGRKGLRIASLKVSLKSSQDSKPVQRILT